MGGGLAHLKDGGRVAMTLNTGTMNALVPAEEWAAHQAAGVPPKLGRQTPWEQICRETLGQLADGGCNELATTYQRIHRTLPRDNH